MTSRCILLLMLVMTSRHVAARDLLTIVAPAAPGGGWDQTARVLQQVLAQVEPGSTVQVENVPGAAGTIGLARFVTAERGNPQALLVTGLVMVSAIAINHSPVRIADTTPIARLTGEYEAIVVPAASPWRTLADLIAAFKAAPDRVTWGGGSAGGTDDLLVRLIAADVGVAPSRANYIAFSGGGAALAALLGDQVSAGVSGYGEFAGQIAAGTLRLLAISSASRVEGIDAPTLREAGINVDLANWRGIVAPPGLTDAERAALVSRIERVAASDEWKAILRRNGWADLLLTGPAFRQFLLAEQHRIESILHRLETTTEASPSATGLRISPASLPTFAVSMLAVLLVIVGVRARRELVQIRAAFPHLAKAAWLVVVLFAYAIAMPWLGFVPASALLFVVVARAAGSVHWKRDAVIAIAATTLAFALFTRGLALALPVDPLTAWLRR